MALLLPKTFFRVASRRKKVDWPDNFNDVSNVNNFNDVSNVSDVSDVSDVSNVSNVSDVSGASTWPKQSCCLDTKITAKRNINDVLKKWQNATLVLDKHDSLKSLNHFLSTYCVKYLFRT